MPKWLHIWMAGSFQAYGETLKVLATLPRVPAYKLNINTHTGPFSGPSSVCTSPSCHGLFTFIQMSKERFEKRKSRRSSAETHRKVTAQVQGYGAQFYCCVFDAPPGVSDEAGRIKRNSIVNTLLAPELRVSCQAKRRGGGGGGVYPSARFPTGNWAALLFE